MCARKENYQYQQPIEIDNLICDNNLFPVLTIMSIFGDVSHSLPHMNITAPWGTFSPNQKGKNCLSIFFHFPHHTKNQGGFLELKELSYFKGYGPLFEIDAHIFYQ